MTTSDPADAADGRPALATVLSAARAGSLGVARLIWRALTSVEGAETYVDTARPVPDAAWAAADPARAAADIPSPSG